MVLLDAVEPARVPRASVLLAPTSCYALVPSRAAFAPWRPEGTAAPPSSRRARPGRAHGLDTAGALVLPARPCSAASSRGPCRPALGHPELVSPRRCAARRTRASGRGLRRAGGSSRGWAGSRGALRRVWWRLTGGRCGQRATRCGEGRGDDLFRRRGGDEEGSGEGAEWTGGWARAGCVGEWTL